MNFLAHIFLSGNDPQLQVGNFIGDAVKGSAYKDYPAQISRGIMMHRSIDSYTDSHPQFKRLVGMLRPHFGRYSPVLADIYMDHILASRFREFSSVSLRKFTTRFYWALIRNRRHLPARIRRFMWHFITTDRLGKYARISGVRESLEIMVRVHRLNIEAREAVSFLFHNKIEINEIFDSFFSDLRQFCAEHLLSRG